MIKENFNKFMNTKVTKKKFLKIFGFGVLVAAFAPKAMAYYMLRGYDGKDKIIVAHSLKHVPIVYPCTSWDNISQTIYPNGMYKMRLVKVTAQAIGSDTPTLDFNIEERAFGSINSAGTDIFSADQTATGAGITVTNFSNIEIAANANLVLTTGASPDTGTVTGIAINLTFKEIE